MIYDVVVIGAGPGGYVAALRAARLGLSTAVVEKGALGGVCLNTGCIPSKALLDSTELFWEVREGNAHGVVTSGLELDWTALQKRRGRVVGRLTGGVGLLLKKAGVEVVEGAASVPAPDRVVVGERTLATRNVLLATGSVPVELPHIKFDGEAVISSEEALVLPSPPRRLAVVGGGAIGLELGSVYARAGSSVTVYELTDALVPTMDADVGAGLEKALRRQGLEINTGTTVEGAERTGAGVRVRWRRGEEEGEDEVDRLLVAVGRRPNAGGIDLDALGVRRDGRGFVEVDSGMRTSRPGVWAIGDLVPGPMLAHKASEEGVVAAERMAGMAAEMEYRTVPSVVYTNPEGAGVGLTEAEAAERGEVAVGRFPLQASGRALAMGHTEGFAKVVADAPTGEILGVHVLAPKGSEIIGEAVLAMGFDGVAGDIGHLVHAHPTLSEALKEAALGATPEGAIHV